MPPLQLLSAARIGSSIGSGAAVTASGRLFHASTTTQFPYKDTQDRESLQPRSSENTRSARDDDVAGLADAAFNPNKTRPETESATAAAHSNGNPLDASGANQELSKPQGDEKTPHTMGAGKETSKGGRSSRGGAQKKGSPGRV